MPPAKENAPSALWLSLLGAIMALFGSHAGRVWDFTVDDAGISFAYAHNLATGHGLVLTPGSERVEAATNFLWVLCLTPADWIHVSHEALSKVLGLAFGAGALAAIALFPMAAYSRKPRYYDLVAPAIAATFAHDALWTISGLENGLYSFLAAVSLVALAWEEADLARLPWSSLTLTLLFATRPDGALYLAAVLGAKSLRALTGKLSRQDVLWAMFLGLGIGSLELFRLAYFAYPVPNSFYTKQRTFEFGKDLTKFDSPGWVYVKDWLTTYKLDKVVKLAPAALLALRAPVARIGLVASVAVGLFFPVYSHGDWMEEWRFLTFFTPILCLALAEALRAVARIPLAVLPPYLRSAVAPVVFALCAYGLVAATTKSYPDRFAAVRSHSTLEFATVRSRARYFSAAARLLEVRSPSVLDPDVGGMSYDSGLRVVDLFGLGDTAIAHTHGVDEPGLREAIFFERRPSFIHLHGLWFTASYLHKLEEMESLYLELPYAIEGQGAEGNNYVRREALAAPWSETSHRVAAPPGNVPWPEGFTVSADGVDPGAPVLVELAFAEAPRLNLHEVVAVPVGSGSPVRMAIHIASDLFDKARFEPGERPTATARVVLQAGRYELRWHADALDVPLGVVTVSPGAGARDVAALGAALDAALARGNLHEARRVAMRLHLRRRVDESPRAREAVVRYARALAAQAAQLGDRGAFGVGVDAARQAQRFAGDDPSVNGLVSRLAERLADASRHADWRHDAATAFTLSRDAVLIDPRRSWMRRRAESLRLYRRTEYDGGRDLAAYRTAVAAMAGTAGANLYFDRALTLLGSVSRWTEAAALVDRLGRTPEAPWARLAAARGYLARGETREALALAQTVPCNVARDPELVRAFQTLTGAPYRPGDAACAAAGVGPGDAPWSAARAPFDAPEGSFEAGSFGRWTVEGRAFGPRPIHDKPASQTFVNGWRGRYYVSSFARDSDAATGTLRSRPFVIGTEAISFLVGGGAAVERVGVRLMVDGAAVLSTAGGDIENLHRAWWDVRAWRGRTAVIEVYDSGVEGWQHITADDFVAEPVMPWVPATVATPAQ